MKKVSEQEQKWKLESPDINVGGNGHPSIRWVWESDGTMARATGSQRASLVTCWGLAWSSYMLSSCLFFSVLVLTVKGPDIPCNGTCRPCLALWHVSSFHPSTSALLDLGSSIPIRCPTGVRGLSVGSHCSLPDSLTPGSTLSWQRRTATSWLSPSLAWSRVSSISTGLM